jgi:hypothetical protein
MQVSSPIDGQTYDSGGISPAEVEPDAAATLTLYSVAKSPS